jgi:2-keto-4-pentenoate hydratase/2-oxohepta-3-ene-1,7-dioic acid hydratase in catechol pathway
MKIFGIGMNYLPHTQELEGRAWRPEEPVIFLKADSALLKDRKPFFVPDDMGRIDYEGELVVRICRLGKAIPQRFAHRYYDAVTVGLDFTARDLQRRAREQGLPWTVCKGFDGSACIGEWLPIDTISPLPPITSTAPTPSTASVIPFRLEKNGTTVQQASTAEMLFSIDELVSYLSRFFTLKTGDLIFTGTPAGVGPVDVGDHLQGYVADRLVLDVRCK